MCLALLGAGSAPAWAQTPLGRFGSDEAVSNSLRNYQPIQTPALLGAPMPANLETKPQGERTGEPALPSQPEQTAAADDEYTDLPPVVVKDPLEPWNRFWFRFNDIFYLKICRPFVLAYRSVVPKVARSGLHNAYTNALFPMRFINSLLQGNLTKASREIGRFIINTTFGVGGLMDLAKHDPKLYPQEEDFGQTLGFYGFGEGFYFVWPFLGPSTLRDSVGMGADLLTSPTTYIFSPFYLSYVIKAGAQFNDLPESIDGYQAMKQSSLEPYVAMRDAYIQNRRIKIEQ